MREDVWKVTVPRRVIKILTILPVCAGNLLQREAADN
jgi:hypothetical protein